MDFDQRSRTTPTFPKEPMRVRAAIAVAAIVASTTWIGGMLGLFEMQGGAVAVASTDWTRFVDTSDDTMRIAEMQAAAGQ